MSQNPLLSPWDSWCWSPYVGLWIGSHHQWNDLILQVGLSSSKMNSFLPNLLHASDRSVNLSTLNWSPDVDDVISVIITKQLTQLHFRIKSSPQSRTDPCSLGISSSIKAIFLQFFKANLGPLELLLFFFWTSSVGPPISVQDANSQFAQPSLGRSNFQLTGGVVMKSDQAWLWGAKLW